MANNQTVIGEEKSELPEGWQPGTYGARYLATLAGMSRENLLRRRQQLDEQLTYSVDEECRRMVALQCVHFRLEALS